MVIGNSPFSRIFVPLSSAVDSSQPSWTKTKGDLHIYQKFVSRIQTVLQVLVILELQLHPAILDHCIKMFEQPVMSTCRVGLVCVIAVALSHALYSTDTGACCGHHWNGLENVQASPPGIRRSFNL
jgi:hypothetical protein